MKIEGIEEKSLQALEAEVALGARFVVYQYCISLIVLTFKRPSRIILVPAGESAELRALPYSLLTFLAGWWGFPWGPIFTIQALFTNLRGGQDVTAAVMAELGAAHALPPAPHPLDPGGSGTRL